MELLKRNPVLCKQGVAGSSPVTSTSSSLRAQRGPFGPAGSLIFGALQTFAGIGEHPFVRRVDFRAAAPLTLARNFVPRGSGASLARSIAAKLKGGWA